MRQGWIAVLLSLALAPVGASQVRAGLPEELREAETLFEAGEAGEAREALAEVVRRYGDNADARMAYYYLALLTHSGLDYIRYLDLYLDHGGRRDPLAIEVELRAGRFYYVAGDYANALNRFESARDAGKDPENLRQARYWLGMTLAALNEVQDAVMALQGVAGDEAPGRAGEASLFALGELHRRNGDYESAADAYETCIKRNASGDYAPAALLGYATTHELLGDPDQARSILDRLIRLYPRTSEAALARHRLRQVEEPDSPPEAPVESPGQTPAPRRQAMGTFSIQLGAFALESNALKMADDLSRRGFPRVRVERSRTGEDLYHVRFGAYSERALAERAGEDVSGLLGLRYQIVLPEDTGAP